MREASRPSGQGRRCASFAPLPAHLAGGNHAGMQGNPRRRGPLRVSDAPSRTAPLRPTATTCSSPAGARRQSGSRNPDPRPGPSFASRPESTLPSSEARHQAGRAVPRPWALGRRFPGGARTAAARPRAACGLALPDAATLPMAWTATPGIAAGLEEELQRLSGCPRWLPTETTQWRLILPVRPRAQQPRHRCPRA